jgi:TPR repeat protein
LDLRVELRLADDTVVDHGALRRRWRSDLTHASNESIGVSALSDDSASKAATNRTPTDSANAHQAVVLSFDRQQIDFLIGRSQQLISEGDVQAARILLRRAAEARDARAALALGATYDPIMLAILKANGMGADVSLARNWYEKAREFGSLEAQQRLNVLVSGTR